MVAMEKKTKERLDRLLVAINLAPTRQKAQALIMAGVVLVDDRRIDKPGASVPITAVIRIQGEVNPYVSRGGLKLQGALASLSVDVRDLTVLDVGASTGGFTDCLLAQGAHRVYALDVGYGQLAWKLRSDSRVVVIERTNIRYYDGRELLDPVDLVTIDTSFISLKLVIPAVLRFLRPGGKILALIKPQFEAGRGEVQKNGVIKDPSVHKRVTNEVIQLIDDLGLEFMGTCESVIIGPQGNREFFILAQVPEER